MEKTKTNLKKNVIWILSMLTAVLILTTACEKDDEGTPAQPKDIVQIAQETPELSTLVSAITAAGLTDALKGSDLLTVFAPTNDAFAKLDPDDLNNIISNPTILTALLQYHVVSGKVLSTDLTTGPVPTLLSGQNVDVDVSGAGVVLNGSSNVTSANIEASNGVIHIIDEVLIPDDFVAQTIVQIAAGNPAFSILVDALSKPELSGLLAAANDPTSDLTVFAPTNDAFAATLNVLGKSSIDDLPVTLLKEIVQYHIVGGATFSDELTDGLLPTLLEGESVEVDVTDGVKINGTSVVIPDVAAINGVIHAVEGVLLPGFLAETVGTIAEVAVFDPNYTVLTNALRKADLLSTVSTTDNLTLFAPDNAAFIAAGITSLDGLTAEDLTPILLYHVVGAKVLSSQLPEDGVVTTLNSDNPKFYLGYLTNDVVLVNGLTQITGVDIEKTNGVVHTINRALVPPANSVVDIAVALSQVDPAEFTVLVSLLTADSLSSVLDALVAAENVTVFAPTDAAFAEIADIVPTLNADQLINILQYHAASARVFSFQLVNNQTVPMLNGESVTINIDGSAVTITDKSGGDDAAITEVNIQGSNGVIHVIDKVLLPTL